MYQPHRAEFTNLLTHSNTVFNFIQNKVTLIYGKNIDVPGSDSNGAGKSTIIEAITIAMTGEPYRDISQDEFIKDGENVCGINLYLLNDFDNSTFDIKWLFTRGKGAKLQIWENGIHNKDITGVPEGKKYIYEKIGINREDLLHYFIINQGNNHSFFSSTDGKQKEVVARFANFQSVEGVIKTLDLEYTTVTKEKSTKTTEVFSVEKVIENLKLQIEEELQAQEEELIDSTKVFTDEIATNEKEITKVQATLQTSQDQVTTLEQDVITEQQNLSKFTKDEEKLKTLKAELQKTDAEIYTCKKEIKLIDLTLSSTITCPACQNEFIHDEEHTFDLDELKANKVEYETLLQHLVQEADAIKVKIQTTTKKLTDKTVIQNNISRLLNQISNLNVNIGTSKTRLKNLAQRNVQLLKKIADEKNNLNTTNNIKNLEDKVEQQNNKLLVLREELDHLTIKQQQADHMLHHFGKKGFMTFLANKTIKVIEQLVNDYLYKFATNLSVRMEGYTKLKSGEIREKIQVNVVKNNLVSGRFARFSGGQKMRVNLCGIFTFQKLINMALPPQKGLNLLILDEDLDGLDKLGNIQALKILDSAKKTVIIISHNNDEDFTGEFNRVRVVNQNENSTLVKVA